jgi:choline dehydrogenase-like flavoprotein
MQDAYQRAVFLVGPVQEVPQHGSRVTVETRLRDRHEMPVVRFLGEGPHDEDLRAGRFLAERAREWLRASGARRVAPLTLKPPAGPSAGQHQAGSCRMGEDPATSVTDTWGRVWGHEGVTVADGSLHVTNGGVNPVLTILALSWRVSEHLAAELGRARVLSEKE